MTMSETASRMHRETIGAYQAMMQLMLQQQGDLEGLAHLAFINEGHDTLLSVSIDFDPDQVDKMIALGGVGAIWGAVPESDHVTLVLDTTIKDGGDKYVGKDALMVTTMQMHSDGPVVLFDTRSSLIHYFVEGEMVVFTELTLTSEEGEPESPLLRMLQQMAGDVRTGQGEGIDQLSLESYVRLASAVDHLLLTRPDSTVEVEPRFETKVVTTMLAFNSVETFLGARAENDGLRALTPHIVVVDREEQP